MRSVTEFRFEVSRFLLTAQPSDDTWHRTRRSKYHSHDQSPVGPPMPASIVSRFRAPLRLRHCWASGSYGGQARKKRTGLRRQDLRLRSLHWHRYPFCRSWTPGAKVEDEPGHLPRIAGVPRNLFPRH